MSVDLVGWEIFRTTNLPVVGAAVNVRAASVAQPNSGPIITTMNTNANGQYSFTGLADGDYDLDITYAGVVKSYKGLTKWSGIVQPSNFAQQSANLALMSPNGTAGKPTFRAVGNADLPSPITKVLQPPSAILDVNGNAILDFTPVAGAVNRVRVGNKATGTNPIVEAVGDGNLGLNVVTAGSGRMQWNGADTWSAPTNWTPTLVQVGILTLSITEARWFQMYKTVFATCRYQVTAGVGTVGNAMLFGGLPIPQRAVVGDKIIGTYQYIDASVGNTRFNGHLICGTGVNDSYGTLWNSASLVGIGSPADVGDVFSLTYRYEIA